MTGPSPRFAYAQARLGARLGARARAADWARLAAIADAASFADAARRTPVGRMMADIAVDLPIHAVEAALRDQWRAEVERVASWYPPQYREIFAWLAILPLLPAISHLLHGREPLPWMSREADLAPFLQPAPDETETRLEAAGLEGFVPAVRGQMAAAACWLSHWQSLWPAKGKERRGLDALLSSLTEERDGQIGPAAVLADPEGANRLLLSAFRRHQQSLVSALAYLGLVALDLQRLRGEIAVRKLLPAAAQGGLAA